MTIGKELSHIEDAKLDDVKAFFFKHYTPCNAILVVGGPVKSAKVMPLVEKWFGNIPAGEKYERNLPVEPMQTGPRVSDVYAAVPVDAFYQAWHMGSRTDDAYHATDIISEVLGHGKSSRLFQKLVKERQLFSGISCYHIGSVDRGLLTIEGKLVKGVSMQEAEQAVNNEIQLLLKKGISAEELQKAKNRTESMLAFEDMHLMSRCNNLAFYELLGDAEEMNREWDRYETVTLDMVKQTAQNLFGSGNSNTLHYFAQNQSN